MASEDDDENIPTLHDVLRPGDGAPSRRSDEPSESGGERADSPLTAAEIEAIAHRVIEQHTEHLQEAITRAIHEAIDAKTRQRPSADHDADDDQG
ncbi:MAG: hypothetical protein U5K73_10690 [Halofilum sp. (in: g-proteobacteria)]|nr:hypothetical protein [Halofilum sp. (in: g-proteobacteria)]